MLLQNFVFPYILLLLRIRLISSIKNCIEKSNSKEIKPEVYYVNLESSIERNQQLRNHLVLLNFNSQRIFRIDAITPNKFVIPNEIEIPSDCKKLSNISYQLSLVESNESYSQANILITSHCGRPRNTKRDMAVTLSHLNAIAEACKSKDSLPYALIMEDDIKFEFDINFSELISSAPIGWGILQLITTNQHDIKQLWSQYISMGRLWTLRSYHDLWCAGAYIINKRILKPLIKSIITKLDNKWIGYDINAGYDKPCIPIHCCNKHKLMLGELLPCFRSPRGYQADHFIFSLVDGHSYIIHTPIVTGASSGNHSTLHQSHVSIHIESFRKINDRIDEMKQGKANKPSFILDSLC